MSATCQTLIVEIRELELTEQDLVQQLDDRWREPANLPPLSREERLDLTRQLRETRDNLRTKRPALSTCFYELPIHAIRVASVNEGPPEISAAQIASWVRYANQVYEPARIRLLFSGAENGGDIEDVTSDLLAALGQNDRTDASDEASRVAALHPGKLVVFFRSGDPTILSSCGPGCGFSGGNLNHVVMPSWNTFACGRHNTGLLAHELGHYLGLAHTHAGGGELPFFDMWAYGDGELSSMTSAVSSGDGRIDVFARGTDNALWQRTGYVSGTSTQWADGWISRGGILASEPYAILHVPAGSASHLGLDPEIHVFALGGDGGLWHATGPRLPGSRPWAGWVRVTDGIDMPISAVSLFDQVHVFARRSNGELSHSVLERGQAWHSDLQAGPLVGPPAAIVRDGRDIEVLARVLGNPELQTRTLHLAGGWIPWASLGGILTAGPAVVEASNGTQFVFGRGADGSLWYRWRRQDVTGPAWEPWAGMGGPGGPPDIWVVSSRDGNVHAFVMDTANRLHHAWGNERRWSEWSRVTHRWVLPAAVSPYAGRVDLFDRGNDAERHQLIHKWFEQFRWSDLDVAYERQVLAGNPNPASVFDGDNIADTPPDPFVGGVWSCDAARDVLFVSGRFFAIERANIMSYYYSPDLKRMSPGQIAVVLATLRDRVLAGTYPQP